MVEAERFLNELPRWIVNLIAIGSCGLSVILLKMALKVMVSKIKDLINIIITTDKNQKTLRIEFEKTLSTHSSSFNVSSRELKEDMKDLRKEFADSKITSIENRALLSKIASKLVGIDQKVSDIIVKNKEASDNFGNIILKVDRLEQIEAMRRKSKL